MLSLQLKSAVLLSVLLSMQVTTAESSIAGFEDLTQAALNEESSFASVNGGSEDYAGVTWQNFSVFGQQYRIDTTTPGPLFGLPHGNYGLTNNQGGIASITTPKILMGLWLGQNEYYGFGAGADQVTIHALNAAGESLSTITVDLPDRSEGHPEVLQWLDTRQFLRYTNIASYRFERRSIDNGGLWIADDFHFMDSAPFPDILAKNSDTPLTLNQQDAVNISIRLNNPENFLNTDADWWIVRNDSAGLRYYDFAAQAWVGGELAPTYQGGLLDIASLEVLTVKDLTAGQHIFYFAVDTIMNGVPDFDVMYFDAVEVNILP